MLYGKRLNNLRCLAVFAREVEEVLASHPQVKEAGVIGVPDPEVGERVKAVVVLETEARGKVLEEEIIKYCQEELAHYKCPGAVEFRGEVPKTDVGKVSRRELREHEELRDRICLCIIGGEPDADCANMDREMARLHEMRERLGISDVVTFLGKREQETLPYHYSAAEVCVVPSHYESFGMVALEAMACGTPVIASRVGGLTFTVQDGRTGFLVPSDDPETLAEKLALLLSDEGLRQQMGLRAADLSSRYGWPRVAGQIVAGYRDLVTHGRRQVCCRDTRDATASTSGCCE